MDAHEAIVGRPTFYAKFSGAQDAATIMSKLEAIGYPTEDVSVLLRPKGTDAVVDLATGERAAGQSGDATQLDQADSDTIVLLHPSREQEAAVRQVFTDLGVQEIQFEPQTVYTARQAASDVFGDTSELAESLRSESIQTESGASSDSDKKSSSSDSDKEDSSTTSDTSNTTSDTSSTADSSDTSSSDTDESSDLRERIEKVQEQLADIEKDLGNQDDKK